MSVSTFTAPPAHSLVQQRDERGRTGSLHAAVFTIGLDVRNPTPLLEQQPVVVWRTACGSDLTASERTPVQHWDGAEAHALLAQPDARRCRRCDRVGDALPPEYQS